MTPPKTDREVPHDNPMEDLLRMDRMPHIWCPGCGIGTTVNCFAARFTRAGIDLDKVAIVSGHRLHRPRRRLPQPRLVPHHPRPRHPLRHRPQAGQPRAQGGRLLRRRRPLRHRRQPLHPRRAPQHGPHGHLRQQLHLRHDRRPGGADHAHHGQPASTTPYGNFEYPFNLPFLADACGAVYVARWTSFHVRQLTKAMQEALDKKGFSFIEVISPCPTLYARRNRLGDGLDLLKYYKEKCGDQARRRHADGADRLPGRDRRRQVRGPRAAALARVHEHTSPESPGRQVPAVRRNDHERDPVLGLGGQGIIRSD